MRVKLMPSFIQSTLFQLLEMVNVILCAHRGLFVIIALHYSQIILCIVSGIGVCLRLGTGLVKDSCLVLCFKLFSFLII